MITGDKLREYIWAAGDFDGYARSGRPSDITNTQWLLIDQMLSAISIIRRGLAGKQFKKEHEEQVRQTFDSLETYEVLREYERRNEPER